MPDQYPTEEIASAAREPIDSDVDLHPGGLGRRGRGDATVLAAIAAGGAAGASVRYLIGQAWPTPAGAFPFSTLAINVLGCALIGVLMVLMVLITGHRRDPLQLFTASALIARLPISPRGGTAHGREDDVWPASTSFLRNS